MSKREPIEVVSYSVERITPLKRHAIWVTCKPNHIRPLVYLQRPAWVNDDQWARILKAIKLDAASDILEPPESES